MAMRTDIIQIEKIAKQVPLDIWDIEMEIFGYDNKIKKVDSFDIKSIKLLQECILHFRKAKSILRSFLKPEDNSYIKHDLVSELDENIGRIDENITKLEKELIEKADTMSYLDKKHAGNIKTIRLRNMLEEAMELLVIRSLITSLKSWVNYEEKKEDVDEFVEENFITEKKGTKTEIKKEVKTKPKKIKVPKDKDKFNYLLLQEMYPSAQSVGGFTRQEIKSFPKKMFFNPPVNRQPSTPDTQEETEKEENPFQDIFEGDEDELI